jgi:hypothetical protein
MGTAAQRAAVVTAAPSGGPLVMHLASSTSFASSGRFNVWQLLAARGNDRPISCGSRRKQALHPVRFQLSCSPSFSRSGAFNVRHCFARQGNGRSRYSCGQVQVPLVLVNPSLERTATSGAPRAGAPILSVSRGAAGSVRSTLR